MTKSNNPFSIVYNNAYLILIITTALWGGNTVAGKLAIGEVTPMVLTACRWIMAASIFLVVAWPHLKRDWPKIKPRLPYVFLMGFCGFAGFNLFLYTSLVFTTAVNVAIIQAGIPMVIFFLNFFIFRIKTTLMQVVGYTLTLFGVILVVTKGSPQDLIAMIFNIGDIIILGGVFLYAAYSVGLKSKPDIHHLSLMASFATAALIISIPFAAVETIAFEGQWPSTVDGILIALYAGVCAAALSQFLFMRGVELIGSNRAGIFINFLPVFGSLFAVLILGEEFALFHLIALILVVGGVMLAQKKGKATESRAKF